MEDFVGMFTDRRHPTAHLAGVRDNVTGLPINRVVRTPSISTSTSVPLCRVWG